MMDEASESIFGDGGGDDLVNVAVPRRFYPLVIQTLGNALSAEGSGQAVPVPERPQEENYRGWKHDDVRRLKQETHNPTLIALFDLSDKADGEPVGIRELEQFNGKTLGQVRGDLNAVTKFGNNKLGLNNTWPFWTDRGADGRTQYRVPENVRRWWTEA